MAKRSGNQEEWHRTLPQTHFSDPVLVLANLGADRVEVLLDGKILYTFGELRPGLAAPRAANAVHWISMPPHSEGKELTLRLHARQKIHAPDAPVILYAAATPLMQHLFTAAAGRTVLALLFVFVGLYTGLAWTVRRRYGMRFSPWFSALTLSLGLGLLIASVMEFLPPAAAARIYYFGLLLILLFPAALWRFMEEALGAGPWRLIRRCWQLQLLCVVFLWLPDLFGIRPFDAEAQLVGNTVLALQLCVGVWVGARYVRTGGPSQRWVALGILLLSLSGLFDIAGALLTGNPRFELYPLGALALVVLLAYDQERSAGEAQRVLRRQAEILHQHQTHLEEQVESRTAQLREATQAAESASRAKSEFLSNMSHELRTPLNAILGHAQLLRGDTTASAGNRERGEIIRQSGEHLLTLINDVLDLARVETGRQEIQVREVEIRTLLAGVVDMLRPRAEQKGLDFQFETIPPLPEFIETDGRRLRQILLNIMGNAIKFTEHGAVRLEVSRRNAHLAFRVIDTGPGLEPEERDRIFESFEQGTGAIGREGTGLGLSISRSLARGMGGEIGVKSEPGRGCQFWLRLPCRMIDGGEDPHSALEPREKPRQNTHPACRLPDPLPPGYTALIEAVRIGDLAAVNAEIPPLRRRFPDHASFLDALLRMAGSFDVHGLQEFLCTGETNAPDAIPSRPIG